jgi:uncharacterized membrane protein
MHDPSPDLRELSESIRDLSERVARLEQRLDTAPRLERTAVPQLRPPRPNLESRIGSQWLNRIGIIAVLIGISYFLKYAFENNYIGPGARVLLGLVAGVSIMLWSEWFRVRFPVFSFSLKAVGLGTLYLSLWAGFELYSLIGPAVAFAAMVAVTLATIILSILQNAEVLGAFALIGGFATPLLISVRQELPLFIYIALLDFAIFALVVYRPWRHLLLIGFAGSTIVYFAWYAPYYRSEVEVTFAFTTLFFAIFAIAPVVQRNFYPDFPWRSPVPAAVALLNAGFYFLEIDLFLNSDSEKALVAFALAAAYLWLGRELRSQGQLGMQVLERLHLGIGIAFLAVAIAVRFETYWITIGWFIEFFIILAIGFRRESAFLRWGALALIAAATIKVFAYDVWRLERGYRIVVFIGLGVLCLAASFVYQNDILKIANRGQKS